VRWPDGRAVEEVGTLNWQRQYHIFSLRKTITVRNDHYEGRYLHLFENI
jgi:hypothetical protein